MHTSIAAAVTFGSGGNAAEYQAFGWYREENTHTCTAGTRSAICLPAPAAPFGYFLEIDWQPILNLPFLCGQSVTIEINGRWLATHQLNRSGLVAFRCPPPPQGESTLVITFHHPDTIKPSDFKRSHDTRDLSLVFRRIRLLVLSEPWRAAPENSANLSIRQLDVPGMTAAAESATGMALNDLLTRFEMLAGNCDMGLALRELGYENLSLLRFGGASVGVADRGLETGFAGLGEKTDADIADNPIKEWMVRDEFGLRFHSGQSSDLVTKEEVLRKFKPYAKMLTRKLLQDLDEGEKIFVYADHKDYDVVRSIETALPIFLSLRRRSNARMLWVTPARNDPATKGSVREIIPGLAQASLDILAPPVLVGGGITVSGWLTVLCNAARVFGLTAQ